MNERIKELREQAWTLVSNEERDRGELYEAREQWERCDQKFAELIVHQILNITDAHTEVFQTDRDNALIEHIKQSVKQHFGVEE